MGPLWPYRTLARKFRPMASSLSIYIIRLPTSNPLKNGKLQCTVIQHHASDRRPCSGKCWTWTGPFSCPCLSTGPSHFLCQVTEQSAQLFACKKRFKLFSQLEFTYWDFANLKLWGLSMCVKGCQYTTYIFQVGHQTHHPGSTCIASKFSS